MTTTSTPGSPGFDVERTLAYAKGYQDGQHMVRLDWTEALDLIDGMSRQLSTHTEYLTTDWTTAADAFVARFRGEANAGPRPGVWPSGEVAEP